MRNPSVASFLQAIVTTCRNDKRIERTVANRAYAFGFILNLMTFSKVADAANAANASWFTKTQTAARSFANVATKLGFASHPKKAVRNATAIPSQAGKQISPSVAQSSDLLPNPETSTEELNINEDITYSEAIETLEMIVDQRRAKGRSTHGQTKSGAQEAFKLMG
jgi:hypothetical protein